MQTEIDKVVVMCLSHLIDNDYDGFIDQICELAGDCCLQDVDYKLYGCEVDSLGRATGIKIRVTGVSEIEDVEYD